MIDAELPRAIATSCTDQLPLLLTNRELASLLKKSITSVQDDASRAPWRLPPRLIIPGATGVRYAHVEVLRWLDDAAAGRLSPPPAKESSGRRRGRSTGSTITAKIQNGKLAAYFLTVVRTATSESLQATPSTLGLPTPLPVRSEKEIAADAAKAAEHEASRLNLRKIHDAWSALESPTQETIRDRFMAEIAEGNPIVYGSLRRSGKLADQIRHRMLMEWLIDDAQLGSGTTAIAAGRGDE